MESVLAQVRIEPIDAAFGAYMHVAADEVTAPGVPEDIMDALDKYGVLVFPEIGLTDEQFLELSAALGERHSIADVKEASETRAENSSNVIAANGVYQVRKDKDDQLLLDYVRGNDYWHMDGTAYDVPGKSTMLKCEQPPSSGGDTEFADLFAAWESLPQSLKDDLEKKRVVHSFRGVARFLYDSFTDEQLVRWDSVFPATEHPLVWHQKDGRTSLLIGSTANAIVGMDEKEGWDLLGELVDMCTTPQFVYRHKWKKGDMVMFNNPGMLHRSTPYDKSSGRVMHRATLKGTEPIEA